MTLFVLTAISWVIIELPPGDFVDMYVEELIGGNDVVSIGGFIGKTENGTITTYERGGSDRTAADIGILFHKKYDATIDLEKDSSVVSADPKIVQSELDNVMQLSYNEARLAGMFGMKIIDRTVQY